MKLRVCRASFPHRERDTLDKPSVFPFSLDLGGVIVDTAFSMLLLRHPRNPGGFVGSIPFRDDAFFSDYGGDSTNAGLIPSMW